MIRLLFFPALIATFCVDSAFAIEIGKAPADLNLVTIDGQKATLHGYKGKTVVVVFLSFECPVSTSYVSVLNELADGFKEKKVVFLAAAPTQDEASAIVKQAKEFKLNFPIIHDSELKLAKALGAGTVPEVFVLDGDSVLRYRGRIDDRYAERLVLKQRFTHNDLRDALEAITTGKSVKEAKTQAVGCPIFFPREKNEQGKVTFYRDVLPILQKNCQQCHRTGEAAPFPLVSYKHAVTWADDIKSFTQRRKMPPWKPTEGVPFKGERRMTDAEIATIAAWVEEGTPEGNLKDAKPAPHFPDGWQLGQPDLVLEPKEEIALGPTGADTFRSFVLPTKLKEDKFVVAYEVHPGNRQVVHHTVHFLDARSRGKSLEDREATREKKPNEKDRGPGYSSRMGPGFFPPDGDVGGWAPGIQPFRLPDGIGYYLPKDIDVVMQVHYHRSGKVEKDRTRLGLYFAKSPTVKPLQAIVVPGWFLSIPAGEANHKVTGEVWLAQDSTLYTVVPHMHLLGKSIKISMTPPKGPTTTLIAIKEWDFNWQDVYFYKEPIRAVAGTKFSVEAVFDNSDKNPNNPSSPPRRVVVGEETTNEMCLGFIGLTTDNGKPAGFRLSPTGFVLPRPGLLPKPPE